MAVEVLRGDRPDRRVAKFKSFQRDHRRKVAIYRRRWKDPNYRPSSRRWQAEPTMDGHLDRLSEEAQSEDARIDLYRQDDFSVRVRVIDPRFSG